MSEETRSGFNPGREYREKPVITSVDELTAKNSPYRWNYVKQSQAGGREAFFAKIQAIIDKEGGLSQLRMDELGIEKDFQGAPEEQTKTE